MVGYTWDNILQKNKNGGNVSAIISDDNTITDPIEIAQNFNNFFTSIVTNLQKKIPPKKILHIIWKKQTMKTLS